MRPERFKAAEAIFKAACDLPGEARSAYVQRSCGDDSELADRVCRMLAHDGRPAEVFESPAASAVRGYADSLLDRVEPARELPERIGSYRVLRLLGEGGFGTVYLAEQQHPRREVAVKVLRASLATPGLLKRFEYEAQVLGRLQHPGIAQIYEAGTAEYSFQRSAVSGQPAWLPFLAMEYVPGLPLDQYAAEHRLALRARLELFARVCDVVQYAHQRGVIHRDLKPANILVATEPRSHEATEGSSSAGGPLRGFPKILDFGVARMTDPDVEALTLATSPGQLIGTLPYMSPEQVTGDVADIDTRSDVYSLGVVLYELLTERLPYVVKSRPLPEAIRAIREDSPVRPGSIVKTLRGELEIILGKALEKDRQRRYQSAADLAADVRRYLSGEPIEARRDSALYVLRKTINRHRLPVAAAVAFVLLLAVSSVVAWTLRGTARRSEIEARAAAAGERTARSAAEAALYDSLVAQAKAVRHTGRVGQRFEALDALGRAAAIEPSLELRNEAIAAMALVDIRPVEIPSAHRLGVAVSFDPDVEHCAILMDDFSAEIFRLSDDQDRARIPPLEPRPRSCFHRLGRDHYLRLYWSGPEARRLDVWRIPKPGQPATETAVRIMEVPDLPYQGNADVTDDERLLAVSGNDSAIHIYDLVTRREIGRVETDGDPKYLSFSPNGERIAVYHGDFAAKACVVDWRSGETKRIFEGAEINWNVAWHPHGRRLAGADDLSVPLWDLGSGRSLGKLPAAHNNVVAEVQFSPDGETLITKGWDGAPVLWDAALFTKLVRVPGEVWASGPGQFSADGRRLAGADARDGALLHPVVYELVARRELFRLVPQSAQTAAGGSSRLTLGTFSADGGLLFAFTTTDDGPLSGCYVFDVLGRRELVHLPSAGYGDAAFDPNGRFVLLAGADGLWMWPMAYENGIVRMGPARRLRDDRDLTEVQVAANGRVALVRGDGPSELLSFSVDAPQAATVLAPSTRRVVFALSPDGRRLVTRGEESETTIWDSESGRATGTLPGRHIALEISPDGALLATSDLAELCLWDLASAARVRRVAAAVDRCTFSPDGSLLAVRAGLMRVRLLRTDTLEEVASLEVPDMAPHSFAFSPDGTKLAAFMARNLATYVWDLREVRAHLARLNLDWELPAYPRTEATAPPPLRLEIDWGDWRVERRVAP